MIRVYSHVSWFVCILTFRASRDVCCAKRLPQINWLRASATINAPLRRTKTIHGFSRGAFKMATGCIKIALYNHEQLFIGRILDLKTGTVKKEGQQGSVRMSSGSRRAFICRMKCGKVQVNSMTSPRHLRA